MSAGKAVILSEPGLRRWLDVMAQRYTVFAPVTPAGGETSFAAIKDAADIDMDYRTAMIAPRVFIYPSRQELFTVDRADGRTEPTRLTGKRVIFGIHACDMHAIRVLDRTFLGTHKDIYYAEARDDSFTIVLNCNRACEKRYPQFTLEGFCASMKTGPFLMIEDGYDIELTALSKGRFLAQTGSQRAQELLAGAEPVRDSSRVDLIEKSGLRRKAGETFKKSLNIEDLPAIMARNAGHPIYRLTADNRCLNCTNCTMVCPTCYCYNLEDSTTFDLATTRRRRRWDSCQEIGFARLDHGNLRPSRGARLRQFVMHKLGTWMEQFGCLGCVGCGRCMTWCPTHIDLRAIGTAIRKFDERKRAHAGKSALAATGGNKR